MAVPLSLKTRLSTPLLEATRDWYRDLLGLSVLEEWDEPGDRGCILGLAGADGEAFLEVHRCEDSRDFAGVSLQFRVADVAQFQIPDDPRFAHRGPIARPWGSTYLFFTDPNGVIVVVFSCDSL
ncbi:VOC family protein [Sphingomonas mesophila]|uniref:VOC family protein n=1 Tax=Sphingomonas mesophila TaxID=2303576 RepID=UPI0013C3253D|nr:VOC family protein [Sphingomonas mesophila]